MGGSDIEQRTDAGAVVPVPEASYAEKLKARLDYLEDWYFRPHAYETKISQWEVKELRTHRPYLWKDDAEEAGVEGGNGSVSPEGSTAELGRRGSDRPTVAMMIPAQISKASDLAQFLHDYFKERISIAITQSLLSNWRKGVSAGEVLVDGKLVKPPPFPNKNQHGNRWVTQDCIDWVEHWIVPQKGVGGSKLGVGGTGAAIDFDVQKKEHEVWKMKREREIADGKFKSVEVFNQHVTAFGLAVNRALNEGEKVMKKAILSELSKVQGPKANVENSAAVIDAPLQQMIEDAVAKGARAAIDDLRECVARAVREVEEPAGVTAEEQG